MWNATIQRLLLALGVVLFLLAGLKYWAQTSAPPAPAADTAAAPAEPSGVDILDQKKLYSQFDEELIIRDFFRDRKGGVFLDVGCSKPIENSTTYYLERHLGWSGIGVDALPEFREAYEKERPRTRFANYIVSDHSGTVESFYRVKGATGLSSTKPDLTWEGRPVLVEEIKVPTITLTELLDEAGVTEIDFLSMDIEGGAPAALRGFDIERFSPELVCIERYDRDGNALEYAKSLLEYFASHGYERLEKYDARDRANFYFAPATSGD